MQLSYCGKVMFLRGALRRFRMETSAAGTLAHDDVNRRRMRSMLQEAERRSGLSPWEIANKLGISYSHYTKIKRGEKNPSLQLAKDMADLFNESVDTLFLATRWTLSPMTRKGGIDMKGKVTFTPDQINALAAMLVSYRAKKAEGVIRDDHRDNADRRTRCGQGVPVAVAVR